MYLTIRNLAEAIFTINLIGGLFLLTKRPVPTFALGIVSFFLAMQKGIVMVCQIRMGISAVLGVTLLLYTSDKNANALLSPILPQYGVYTGLASGLVGVIGSWMFPYITTLSIQPNTFPLSRRLVRLIDLLIIGLGISAMALSLHWANNDQLNVIVVGACLADSFGQTQGQRLTMSRFFLFQRS